ncbi:hypothetical protein V8F33_010297 [Rhypophila sp. PSN 637]
MADPSGILGVIGVATQLIQMTVQFGLDWKDGRHSTILLHLGDQLQGTAAKSILSACETELEKMAKDLKKRAESYRASWEALKGAFTAKKTRESVENLHRQYQALNSMAAIDAIAIGASTYYKQIDFIKQRQSGTSQWLLKSPEFQEWLQGDRKTLFYPGIPGAGKTILTATVVEHLVNQFYNDPKIGISYIYCNFQRTEEQKLDDLLTSLLKQLAELLSSLPKAIIELHERYKMKRIRPSTNELLKALYTYNETMERINKQEPSYRELANQVLLWITCAKRLLTTTELSHTLTVEPGDLELDESDLMKVSNIVVKIQDISTICITCLSFSEFETGSCETDDNFEQRLQNNPLYDYAARNWGRYARQTAISPEEVNRFLMFLTSPTLIDASSQALLVTKRWSGHSNYSQEFPRGMTGVHVAAYFGVGEAVVELLKAGADVNAKDDDGGTPLQWASRNGHNSVVQQLLVAGADVNAKAIDGGTPLHWASGNGHDSVVQQLLEAGADVNAKDYYGGTPLEWASASGHNSVVQQLLQARTKMVV